MAELGVAANVIAVIQLTGTVIASCASYISKVKNAEKQIEQLVTELSNFQVILTSVVGVANAITADPVSPRARNPCIHELTNMLAQCQRELTRLQEKLDGNEKHPVLRKLLWPLKEGDVEKVMQLFERVKSTITMALAVDQMALATNQMSLATEISGKLQDVSNQQTRALLNEKHEKIWTWLAAPDPSTNRSTALELCHEGTGLWILKAPEFSQWKQEPHSFIWLHGISGCGKSILCTTIIEDISRHCHLDTSSSCAYAYFYFDFSDPAKEHCDKMLCSLLYQFSLQSEKPEISLALDKLYTKYDSGKRKPLISDLLATLEEILKYFSEPYIVLDALDECVDREKLWPVLEALRDQKEVRPHILVTSRRERDIVQHLGSSEVCEISIKADTVHQDIQLYVKARLNSDPNLKRWLSLLQDIELTLTEKADGMFRWVSCQLDQLSTCLTLSEVKNALQQLPESLDETYNRILVKIHKRYIVKTQKVLQWLAFSYTEVTLAQIMDVLATRIEDVGKFVPEDRLIDPVDILAICSSLITLVTTAKLVSSEDLEDHSQIVLGHKIHVYDPSTTYVKLAHASVKDFLVSSQVNTMTAAFSEHFESVVANHSIAKTCMIYLFQFNAEDSLYEYSVGRCPLAEYSAKFSSKHAQAEEGIVDDELQSIIMRLLQEGSNVFINHVRLCPPDEPWNSFRRGIYTDIATPLYYCAIFGFKKIVQILLSEGANVNAQGGHYGNALQAASHDGNLSIVQLLLAQGADVNAQGGWCGNALQAASSSGNLSIVELLLEQGAEVNAQGGWYRNALHAASYYRHLSIVELLLAQGADVNAQGGHYGHALPIASENGHLSIVKLLLSKGADVNAQSGLYGNALHAASDNRHLSIVKLLLAQGADVNAQGGRFGNALQAASRSGNLSIVELLLAQGADVNAQGGEHGNALQAASASGNLSIVELLLAQGAEVNAQGRFYGNALQAASHYGYLSIVELLLAQGAEVNAQGGHYGNALYTASENGHLSVVELLLAQGADVNAQGEFYGNALQAVSSWGYLSIVELLLAQGADVNGEGGIFGTALHAAAHQGHSAIFQLLLQQGAIEPCIPHVCFSIDESELDRHEQWEMTRIRYNGNSYTCIYCVRPKTLPSSNMVEESPNEDEGSKSN